MCVHHKKRLWFVLIAIGQLFGRMVQCNELQRPKTMSELQNEYLTNEEMVWQQIDQYYTEMINSTADTSPNNYANETWIEALNIHRSVFFDNTFDINSYWRSYLLFRIANFHDLLSNINSTLEENYRFLFDENEHIKFNPTDIERWAHESMFNQLKENSDGLYTLTVHQKDTVLQHIQTVSICYLKSKRYQNRDRRRRHTGRQKKNTLKI